MEFYLEQFSQSFNLPDYMTFIILYLSEFIIVSLFLLLMSFVVILTENKFCILLSKNNVNILSCCKSSLTIVADTIKQFSKENIIPKNADKIIFAAAPIFVVLPILIICLMLPYNTDFCALKSDSGLIIFLSIFFIQILGIVLGAISSGSKFSQINAARHCLQIISSGIPMILVIIGIAVLSGTLSLSQIVISQAKYDILSWYIFPSILGFLIFFVMGLSLLNKSPLSFTDNNSDYKTECSGINYALLNLSEYSSLFILCTYMATIFMGGFLSPFGIYVADWFATNNFYYLILTAEQIFWLLSKTAVLVLLITLMKISLPKYTPENIVAFSWKYLIPLSVINLIIICVVKMSLGGFYV